jgi:3-phosphoshikimate 1-carboxyvinyltransferase
MAPPPSKSVTHRYLNLVLLSGAPARVGRPLLAEDTRLFLDALAALGWSVEVAGDAVALRPPAAPPAEAALYCGNAGTLFRFLTASAATLPGRWRIDGTPRLRERPVGPLVAALSELGARIEAAGADGHAPLTVAGGTLRGGRASLDAGESSQYLSALLMAALVAPAPTELRVSALASEPYVELTRAAIRRFCSGAPGSDPVSEVPGGYRVLPARPVPPPELVVEGDWSAACYPAAAAALTRGRVLLDGLDPLSPQGDRGFLDLLARMGAEVSWTHDGAAVAGGELAAVEVDLSSMPDQVPTLAALAPFARGTTRVYNVANLRIKESDRLRALAEGLSRCGVAVEERPDGLVIPGCWSEGAGGVPAAAERVVVDPAGDHRIAMSFALLGLRRGGVGIADPEVVAKSYPGFWQDLEALVVPV